MATREDRAAIEKIVRDQEEAIESRGFKSLFARSRDAFVNSTENDHEEQSEVTLLVKRYLMSSSFIAAHYRLANDKANRDKAAQSCAILLSTLGHDPQQLLEDHIRCEDLRLLTFKKEGISQSSPIGCTVGGIIAVLGLAGLAYWLLAS